jgi:hypothetical protein
MRPVRRYEETSHHTSRGLVSTGAGLAAEVARSQQSPLQGNSPNDRMLRGPDCDRPKRVCAAAFPATPSPPPPRIEGTPRRRFSGMAESIGPIWSQDQNHANLGAECRLPLVGPRAPVQGRDGRTAPYPSSTMSSGRLFLDRVARQHCPSPLHRQLDHKMLDRTEGRNYH